VKPQTYVLPAVTFGTVLLGGADRG
jgi:hypothetical protein